MTYLLRDMNSFLVKWTRMLTECSWDFITIHYSDVTWASGVTIHRQLHCLFNSLLRQCQRRIKAARYWPFRETYQWSADSTIKGPVMRKTFPCHSSCNVLYFGSICYLWASHVIRFCTLYTKGFDKYFYYHVSSICLKHMIDFSKQIARGRITVITGFLEMQ